MVLVGVALDFAVGVALDFTVGVALDFTVGVALDFTMGVALDVTVGVALDVTVGMALDFTVGVALDFVVGVALDADMLVDGLAITEVPAKVNYKSIQLKTIHKLLRCYLTNQLMSKRMVIYNLTRWDF